MNFSKEALELFKTIVLTTGVIGAGFIIILLILYITLGKKLSQKRIVSIFVISVASIWSLCIIIILLKFFIDLKKQDRHSNFVYRGQIIDEGRKPVADAYAFIIIGRDTLRDVTGDAGIFSIELDTTEGINANIYYGHKDFGTNKEFRSLNSSTTEQFILRKKESNSNTFTTNLNDRAVISAISEVTKSKYSPTNGKHNIHFTFDRDAIDSFDYRYRYRYLGGKVQIFVDGKLCAESKTKIPPSHAVGTSRKDLENQISKEIKSIVNKEKDQLCQNIATCMEGL